MSTVPTSIPADIPQFVLDTVANIKAEVPDAQRFSATLAALRALPSEEVQDRLAVRVFEYEIRAGRLGYMQSIKDELTSIAPLSLKCAPEVVGLAPLDDTDQSGVIVLRYSACPGERLLRCDRVREPFGEAACREFLSEMQRLSDHGKIHPYARGLTHWLISSETGTLLLEQWSAVRAVHEPERARMLESIDEILRVRRQAIRRSSPSASASQPPGNAIEEVFGLRRVLLPVVHPVSERSAIASAQVAIDAGCKGIFLINQGMSTDHVLALTMVMRRLHPTLWIGLNLLGTSPSEVLRRAMDACEGRVDGIWTDNAGVDRAPDGLASAQDFLALRQELGWRGLYFGGVAFKYQAPVAHEQLGDVAATAQRYMDVVCTSGPGTGQAADAAKVAEMRRGLGERPALALASGVDENNVDDYLPHADAFLVGTGIEREFGVLDPERTGRLEARIQRSRWA